jgi:Lar family restriction alleviation protein
MTIKPCPICGKPARLRGSENVNGSPYYYVCCSDAVDCGCNQFGKPTKEEAIANWNRRSYESVTDQAEP